jgi:sucrose synthase
MSPDRLQEALETHRDHSTMMLRRLFRSDGPFLLRSEILEAWDETVAEGGEGLAGALEDTIRSAQEGTTHAPFVDLAVRDGAGRWRRLRIHSETLDVIEIGVSEYLATRERLALGHSPDGAWPLEVDFEPFARHVPRLKERRSVGRGGEFLNRHLTSQLFVRADEGLARLFRFLKLHTCHDQQLMVDPDMPSVESLRRAVRGALDALRTARDDATWDDVGDRLRAVGLMPGWGRTVDRMRDSLRLLQDVLEAPEPSAVESLLARIPMVFRVAILSPHGFFGQSGVMGLPDTGGQVVYILDQVRALELEMRQRLHEQGVDFEPEIAVVTRLIPEARGTSCDQRLERVAGTRNARILRVPFRTPSGEIAREWVSRFEVWPFLERFAIEVESELVAELDGRPDLIIGNYSDGNLVATLLARRLGVTQFAIAHALEKSKYLYSDLYWHHNEASYHFSCQFAADLVAMNAADCIVTSTYQEIAGDDETVGQYESYGAFTMPGFLRVVHGIDVWDPRFNIVSPGVAEEIYFPAGDDARRLRGLHPEIEEMVLGGPLPDGRGRLEHPDRPIVLSMARLDRIKNLTGLVDWYGSDERLRELANLVIVAGRVSPDDSADGEERAEIERMHQLFDHHGLDGSVRWVGRHLDKAFAGELYRWVADRRGAFVQPALFEAFGLTVLEAMASGLPTFATRYGGPLEIIQDGVSGFHLDPNRGDLAAGRIADFFEACASDPVRWTSVAEAGIARVESRYTWSLHASRLMTLARLYGFWRFVTDLDRAETDRYLQTLYHLAVRARAVGMETA